MMNMQQGDLCLVTGISGYLASWVGHYLLQEGYRVRGTVRSLSNREQVDKVRELLPGVELVEADLRKEAGWAEAVAGVKWVFHVASPQAVRTETDRVGGATKGTELLMQAALTAGSVRKIVVTSSEAAIAYGHAAAKLTFTEDDWTDINSPNDYFRSKTRAEKIAWDMVRDPARNLHRVALSAINPSMILGPSLIPWGRFSSESVKNMAEGKMPLLPDMTSHYVDVRDCARMHIALMNDPRTDGHRHFSFGAKGRMADLAQLIRESYGHLGFKPSTRLLPKALLWPLKLVSKDVASVYSKIGTTTHYQTKHPHVYRYEFCDLRQMVRDTMDSMLANNMLAPKRK